MLGKTLHRMMPVSQLKKNDEGLNSWHLYLAYYLKFVERNVNPYTGLSKLWIMSSFMPVALLWYFPLLFALPFLHDWTFWCGLALSQPVCAAGPIGCAERRPTDGLCAVTQPQRASVHEHCPGIWQCPKYSLGGTRDRERLLQVQRVQGIFSFETTEGCGS